jgi:tetratricopeptide (TPR) repeat protein
MEKNKSMKIFALIAFLVLGCDSEKKNEKYIPNPDAVKLYKEAWKISIYEVEYNEKVDSAIVMMENAMKIDSLYIEPYLSIIGLATLKKDKKQAIKYCLKAQNVFIDFPEFIVIEGVIHESNNDIQRAKKLYKKALDIYENKLIDEMEEKPDLELHYIECLYINNQKKKAKLKLEELKANNKGDSFYEGLTIEDLTEAYRIIKKR